MKYEPRTSCQIDACQIKDIDRTGSMWAACVKEVSGSFRVRTSKGLQYATEYDWILVSADGDVSVEDPILFQERWKQITPQVGDIWRHIVRGSEYLIVAIAQAQSKGDEGKLKVVYADTDNGHKVHEREFNEFCDGRFERIAP